MVAEQEQALEERHAAARERWLAHYEGDPEMQEIVRKAKLRSCARSAWAIPTWGRAVLIPSDTESTPEEDAEDIRISNERRAKGVSHDLEDVLRELAEEFPDEAEDLLAGL